jgi:protease-4
VPAESSLDVVLVEIAGLEIGMAAAQEIHDLLRAVRNSGKRVIAVLSGDNVSSTEYLVACAATEIIANPDSAVMMLGVAAGNIFLKDALQRFEIEAQTLQWKEYKGAAEMFGRDSMSLPLRESIEAIVTDRQRVLEKAVSESRKIEPSRARDLLNSGFLSTRQAQQQGLVDRLGYVEDFHTEFNPDHDLKKVVSLPRMLRRLDYLESKRKRPLFALIYGVGPVITGDRVQPGDALRAESTAAQIEEAARDAQVRAIIFRVNSPGGSAVGSDLVWRSVAEARRLGKPVVVSMGDVAGSGGYYVAMGADAIVAEPSTITGSIGVVYMKLSFQRLLERIGVHLDFVKTGEISDALSPARPMSEAELSQLNSVMGELYDTFTAKVAEGRKLTREAAESLARGRIWSGEAALASGLVDSLGGVQRAVEIAREKVGLKADQPHRLVPFAAAGGLFGLNLQIVPASTAARISWPLAQIAHLLKMPESWMPTMIDLMMRGRPLMLTPFF